MNSVDDEIQDSSKLLVGKIAGVYGLKGWVKVYSHTQPIENILTYPNWWVLRKGTPTPIALESGRIQGKGILAKLAGVDDPDQAKLLVGLEIMIDRDALATLGEDEFYWSDLIGLEVQDKNGTCLGVVDHLLETGANLVLIVKTESGEEHLIPWIWGSVVLQVDVQQRLLLVDWDPDY